MRAQHLAELERWSDALETLRPALTAPDTAYDATCLESQCMLGLGRPGQARVTAERAVTLEPGQEWAHRLRAIALMQRARRTQRWRPLARRPGSRRTTGTPSRCWPWRSPSAGGAATRQRRLQNG